MTPGTMNGGFRLSDEPVLSLMRRQSRHCLSFQSIGFLLGAPVLLRLPVAHLRSSFRRFCSVAIRADRLKAKTVVGFHGAWYSYLRLPDITAPVTVLRKARSLERSPLSRVHQINPS